MAAHDAQDELHQVLTGRRPGRTAPWALYALPVIILAVGGGYWVRHELTRPAVALGPVETTICEQLLAQATATAPTRFYICASRAKTIYRLTAGRRIAMPLMANAVYELPLDGRTQVEGLSSPDMRYGYRRGYCTALKPAFENKTFLLAEPPVDLGSC